MPIQVVGVCLWAHLEQVRGVLHPEDTTVKCDRTVSTSLFAQRRRCDPVERKTVRSIGDLLVRNGGLEVDRDYEKNQLIYS